MLQTKLHSLIDLAREPSSERRRELLREVTDLFFVATAPSATEMALFDTILTQLAGDMEQIVRAELSGRMAETDQPPPSLLRSLARDASIAVAEPILSGSSALLLEDQIEVARTLGQDHLRALSRRTGVSADVTDAIVERGDDQTLGLLLRNATAELSRHGHESVIDRAAANPELHEAVVERASLPPDLLNEMYFIVESRLRDRILARNAELDPAALDAALKAGRERLAEKDGALPADYAEAEAEVRVLRSKSTLTPPALVGLLRQKSPTRFLVALSQMADIDFHTARRILEKRELDALAIVCKAADFDRALFLTFALLVLGSEGDAMGRAREYGELYSALPKDSALRTIRFWRMRRSAITVEAA